MSSPPVQLAAGGAFARAAAGLGAVRAAAIAVACLLVTAAAWAAAPRPLPTWPNSPPLPAFPEAGRRTFTLHWAGRTPLKGDEALAHAVPIDFGKAAVRQDVVVLREDDLGPWPRGGLEGLVERPESLDGLVAGVVDAAAGAITPADFDGLVIVDFRGWTPLWERYPPALQDRFRRTLRKAHPEALAGLSAPQIESACREAFAEVVRGVYGGVLDGLRARWPKARYSFAFLPPMIFGMDPLLPKATMGYGEVWPNPASTLNDRLGWLVERCDFVTVAALPWAMSVGVDEKSDYRRGTIDAVLNWRFYASNVREGVRLARGKPVFLYSSLRYAQDWGRMTGRPPLTDLDLHQVLTAAASESGVHGLVLGEELRTPGEVLAWERDLAERVWPATEAVLGRWGARVVPRSEPLPTWPNVGNLARAGKTVPRGYDPARDAARFTAPPR